MPPAFVHSLDGDDRVHRRRQHGGAIVGGLVAGGQAPETILVVDPGEAQRRGLAERFAVRMLAAADPSLASAALVVWAVKPQLFRAAAAPCAPWVAKALQLSVMAGIRSDAIAKASGSERVVRAMPNTPALIGQGVAGVYARPAVSADDRQRAAATLAPTGKAGLARRGGGAGCGHRAFRLRPGLRVPSDRSDARGRP